jgi:hypothetical protein
MPAFQVGQFQVRTGRKHGRWVVSIDGSDLPSWYMTEARAAGAGLLAAHRLVAMGSGASLDDGETTGAAA